MLSERHIRTPIRTMGVARAASGHRMRIGRLALVTLTAVALGATPAAGAPAGRSTSPVLTIPPPAPPTVVGTSTLVRTDHGVSASLETSALTPGDAVTLWWIVFNTPEACEHPFAGSPCGPPDARNPETGAAVLHAAGRIVDDEGTAGYGAHLRVGDPSRALLGPGLLDPRAALVILVLKTHGPKIPELASEMLRTFAGGCSNQDDVPPGAPQDLVGTPGPNDCAEIQFSVHRS